MARQRSTEAAVGSSARANGSLAPKGPVSEKCLPAARTRSSGIPRANSKDEETSTYRPVGRPRSHLRSTPGPTITSGPQEKVVNKSFEKFASPIIYSLNGESDKVPFQWQLTRRDMMYIWLRGHWHRKGRDFQTLHWELTPRVVNVIALYPLRLLLPGFT